MNDSLRSFGLDWIEHCFTSLPVSVFHLETFECETV